MKNVILLLVGSLLSSSLLQGIPVALDKSVEKPPYPDLVKDTEQTATALKLLLEQGQLEEFYKKSRQLLRENGRIQQKDPHQFQNELWTFYYIAAAPLFQIDPSPDFPIPWRENKTLDYDVKTTAVRYIAVLDINQIAAALSLPKDQITDLYSLYIANILRNIKQSYETDLEKKQHRRLLEQTENNRKLLRQQQLDYYQANLRSLLLHNRTCTEDLRNNAANNRRETLEKTFLNLLVEYFPGNAAKVRKYIKLAGYSDKEIPVLIDRTIGRGPKTEFLYKGAGRKKASRP